MFEFLKKKLHGAISKFSKEVEQEVEEEAPEKEETKKTVLGKIKEKITTKALSENKFNDLFWGIELSLLENNVAVEVIERLKANLKDKLINTRIKRREIDKIITTTLKSTLDEILSFEKLDLLKKIMKKRPFIIMFVGINGSGKTTTIAKMAKLLQDNKLTSVMAAADTFRAAAQEQLEEHSKRLQIKVVKHDYGSDPAAVAFDAIRYAEAKKIDAVLIDTAGRMQSNTNLMDELKKIKRVAKPDLVIFVGESITGNDCIDQVTQFNQAIEIDGIILAKADVDEKGGTAISVSFVTGKPILYLGTGQEYKDLKVFEKEEILKNIGLA